MSMIGTIVRSASLHRNFRKTSNLSYSVWKSVKCNRIQQNGGCQDILIRFTSGPGIHGARLNTRYLTTTAGKTKEPSSKIEETVERLKEKKKAEPEVAKETEKVAAAKATPVVKVETTTTVETPGTKTLWVRFKDEVRHYYSGFKLLFLDVNVSSKILWKIVRGKPLTRRESRQLVRTTSDLFRLVPFSVFVIVPFMEILLPVALKLFPGMLPSTFTTSSQREEKLKKALQAKLEYTRFLQKTLDGMGPKASGSRSSRSAADFSAFYQDIKKSNEDRSNILDNDKIMKFAKLFEDDITLDNMDRNQLSAICRLLNLTPIGTSPFLRLQIELKLRGLKADDRLIQKEGMPKMSHGELQNANLERGMPAFGLSEERLKAQLGEWIDLSLNYKVPPSLLLLSRTLYNIDNLAPTQKIASAISALPEKAASATSATIGEREGKIRNVDRLERIKEEQRKIEQEAKEQAKIDERKQKEQDKLKPVSTPEVILAQANKVVESVSPIKKATVTEVGEVKYVDDETLVDKVETNVDKAPILVDNAPELEQKTVVANEDLTEVFEVLVSKKVGTEPVSTSSLSDLKVAIESLGISTSEEEKVKEIKKELEEYNEDVRELDEVKNLVSRLDLRESMAAKLLFGRVNKMLRKTDKLVEKLHIRKDRIHEELQNMELKDQQDEHKEQIVTIQEIIEAVNKLQKSPNQAKVDQIAQVLSMMDADADGVIKVDHVLKVIELLGVENTELPAKQIKQILNVLNSEEKLLLEDNIENILIKKSPFSQDQPEVDEAFAKDLKALEEIASTDRTTSSATSGSTEKSTPATTKSTPVQPSAKTQHQSRNGENH